MIEKVKIFTRVRMLRKFLNIIEARLRFYGELESTMPQSRISAAHPVTGDMVPLVWEPGMLHQLVRRDRAVKQIAQQWFDEGVKQLGILSRFMKQGRGAPGVTVEWLVSGAFAVTTPDHGDGTLNRFEREAEFELLKSIVNDDGVDDPRQHAENYRWFFMPLEELELEKGMEFSLEWLAE